jgi:hypothetical protein
VKELTMLKQAAREAERQGNAMNADLLLSVAREKEAALRAEARSYRYIADEAKDESRLLSEGLEALERLKQDHDRFHEQVGALFRHSKR